ncbi:MAG: TonB-dependent receptor [Bacteroidales bacterium]
MSTARLCLLLLFYGLLVFGRQTVVFAESAKTTSLPADTTFQAVLELQEITVTAQKRPELSRNVPISLSNLPATFLEKNVIETMGGMAAYVPGVQVQEQSVLLPGYVIRGLTSDNPDMNVDNRVSLFQDGIYIGKQLGSAVEFFDMDRVEVLKGPQGTLFGRSAQIGAIHLVSKRATNETSGSLALGTGNYNQFRTNGYINLPLVHNKLFLRVAGIYNRRDGYVKNLSGGYLMGKNSLANRTSLSFRPDNNNTLDLIFSYQHDRAPGTAFKSSVYAPQGGNTDPFSFVDLEAGKDLVDQRDVYAITAQYKRVLSEALSLTAITGYRTLDLSTLVDADGTKADVLSMDGSGNYQQISQELRLNLNKKRFSGFAGLNYFREKGELGYLLTQDERSMYAMITPMLAARIPGFSPIPMLIDGEPNLSATANPITGRTLKAYHAENTLDGAENSAFELFADGTYKLTSKLKITAGIRLILEDQSSFLQVDPAADPGNVGVLLGKSPNNLFKPTDGRKESSKSFVDWVGRAILHYTFSEEVSAYASWSKGRRPNVIEVLPDTTEVLNAEIVYNYELGFKTLLLNRRLQFNMSGFYYDYSHFQTTTINLEGGTFTHVTDSGKATGLGVETDVQFAAIRNFTLFANYAWLHARFNDKDSDGNPQKLAGNSFRLTPKHSGAAGVSYQFVLGKAGSLSLDLSTTFKSGHYFDDENDPALYQGGYGLVNTALQYTTANKKYGIRVNVNNLGNKRYLIDAGNTGLAFGIPTNIPGPPRFFGMQLFANF